VSDVDHTWWYLTRATGLVAYLLLFASVTLGLLLTGDLLSRWLQRFRIYDLHRFLALVTLGLTAVHMFIVLPDEYLHFSVVELLVPFASPYRPTYMGLGAFAFYVMVVVIGAFYLRPRVSYKLWRLVHYATFAVFGMALVHGAGAGTDAGSAWSQSLYALTGLVVFNLTVHRALKGSARGVPQRLPSTGSTVTAGETG
jgi:predicted ferric reductase